MVNRSTINFANLTLLPFSRKTTIFPNYTARYTDKDKPKANR
jgi:hypothetical protein